MSSGFISESEIAERRRQRQEEWEKVRQPDQPQDAPEEEYDPRSLFERLEEQKKKKEYEFEESHRLKNMIKGLDDDEVDFLDLVDRSKLEEERKKSLEEAREIADFKKRVATLHELGLEQRIQQEIRQPLKVNNNIKIGRTSQTKLLAGAVKKRAATPAEPETPNKKTKTESEDSPSVAVVAQPVTGPVECFKTGALSCIGVLPGLGTYDEASSDESDASTDLDEPPVRYDLLGRRIKKDTESSK